MRTTLLFALLLTFTVEADFHSKNHVDDIQTEFNAAFAKFKGHEKLQAYLKRNDPQEKQERMANYREAKRTVEDINDDLNTPFSAGINKISVMTNSEQKAMLNMNATLLHEVSTRGERVHLESRDSPSSLDWVKRGGQPAVKDQGGCGSCWAFAAISAIEGRYFALTGQLASFSEQELLDCTMEYYSGSNDGCSGAWMEWAYSYVTQADRLALMDDYKYNGKDNACSRSNGISNGLSKAKLTSTKHATASSSGLQSAVVAGVVAVAIQVVDDFNYYANGIFTCSGNCNCAGQINHAVTVVGYTSEYWNVRNSWGTGWGDAGYIKMSRSQSNICGIQGYVQIPVLQCRPGHTCDEYDGSEGDGEQDEDEEFDVGEEVQCGEIKHFGGLCVDMEQESGGYLAVTTSAGCSRQFCLTSNGYVQDKATGMCLTVTNPDWDDDRIKFGACSSAYTWTKTELGFKIEASSGKCWHPLHGSPNPPEENQIVIYSGCDEERLTFQMESPLCWEETSGMKLGAKIKDGNGKALKLNSLEDAQDMCVEMDNCQGIFFNSNTRKYFLSRSAQGEKSSSSTDKIFTMEDCEETCDAGTQRCEDGECRERCSEEDGECPAGTTLCPDGVCKHIHMCGH